MAKNTTRYDNLIICYFSGTGNAKNASLWISNAAEAKGLQTKLVNIDRFESIDPPDSNEKTLIGFCTPTHGFNLPPIVIKFIRKFPKVKNTDAFILNTRGGVKLNRFFLPGLSGLAQILAALMLIYKGFRIVGMQPLDLPSNWLILHPALRKKIIDSIYNRCQRVVDGFAEKILSGKTSYIALWSLPVDIALIPIAAGYFFIGRFFLAKTLISTDACNNCGKCEKQCPVKAIKMVNERPFWSYTCESCMRCVNACPERAIETTHAFSISLLLISSLVLTPFLILLMNKAGLSDWIHRSMFTESVWAIIDEAIFLLFVFLSYRILHFFMRYRIVNRLITYTSLSKYAFWRRYKVPRG